MRPASEPAPGVGPAPEVTTGPPVLRFDAVDKTFGAHTRALAGVSFEVPRGQFCVILGPSGSGKSTLLRLVNGLHPPTAGRVFFDGVPVGRKNLARVQRQVGMIHQHFHLVPRLPVLDNVLAGALPMISTVRVMTRLWPSAYQRRACALLDQVGLSEQHLYRRAAELSGGEQQRVAIARAFILEPRVVLADEPVASLDPTISRGVLRLLEDAARQTGATVLCSLHQVELALEFADRIIGIRAGRLVFDGTPAAFDQAIASRLYDQDKPQDQAEAAA